MTANATAGTLHGVVFLLGETGILVTGASGTGKSSLVQGVAALWHHDPVRLVADDRVFVKAVGGRLVARPLPGFLGSIEVRGLGIAKHAAMASAVLRAVVALGPALPERIPTQPNETQVFFGVALPVLHLLQGAHAAQIFITKWPYFRAIRLSS
jgi:HPr kinase/phosphorylase